MCEKHKDAWDGKRDEMNMYLRWKIGKEGQVVKYLVRKSRVEVRCCDLG